MDPEGQRHDYVGALEWVAGLMRAATPGQMGAPTPCEEFTVRDLMGHLVGPPAGARGRFRASPPGMSPTWSPASPTAISRRRTNRLPRASGNYGRQPASDGDRVTAPWGSCTALDALRGFTMETVTHGWDLAVATGQPREAPDQIADRCLLFASALIPDRLRGVMYDKPVADSRDDSPTSRLAHLLGHR
jgi:uncharacterized protein (TIGR03086 family)